MKKNILFLLFILACIAIYSLSHAQVKSKTSMIGEFLLTSGETINGSLASDVVLLKEYKKDKKEFSYFIISSVSVASINRVQDQSKGNEFPLFNIKHTGSKLFHTDVAEELMANPKYRSIIVGELEKLYHKPIPEGPIPFFTHEFQLGDRKISLTCDAYKGLVLSEKVPFLLEDLKVRKEDNQIVDLPSKHLVSYKYKKSESIKRIDEQKVPEGSDRLSQKELDNFLPLTNNLPLGKIAYGLRKREVKFSLLKGMRLEQVAFESDSLKEFFLLVFRGISDSSTVKLSLSDYNLLGKNGIVAGCKAFKMAFTYSDIDDPKGFLTDQVIQYHYDRTGDHEIFTCLLFVIDKDISDLRLQYRNQISNIIPELDEDGIKQIKGYYKKNVNEGASLAQLITEMVIYDIDSYSIYGAYPISRKPIATSFFSDKEIEINDVTRFSNHLIITITLKDNFSSPKSRLILDSKFMSVVKTDGGIWINSSGIPINFEAGVFGSSAMMLLCDYTKEQNHVTFRGSEMTLSRGTQLKDPKFSEYIMKSIPRLNRNDFRTVIPLVFEVSENAHIVSFRFSDFPEIKLTGVKLSQIAQISDEPTSSAHNKNKLTIINGTGEIAFVKIRDMQNGQFIAKQIIGIGGTYTFVLPNGNYKDYVRLGDLPSDYRYSKGEGFSLFAPNNKYIEASLTLQPILDGNYSSQPCSSDEFNK